MSKLKKMLDNFEKEIEQDTLDKAKNIIEEVKGKWE